MAKTVYLLPCSCGEKLQVDRSQAGLSVPCRCGATLSIPTLRGFAELERPDQIEPTPPRTWGARQAVLFLGTLVSAAALLAVGGLWLIRPVFPQQAQDAIIESSGTLAELDGYSIKQTIDLWNTLKQSPDKVVSPEFATLSLWHEAAIAQYRGRMQVAILAAAAGGLLLGLGFVLPKSAARGRKRTP